MIAVIFEAIVSDRGRSAYLDAAATLRPLLECCEGFVSIERFESLSQPGKVLSLSFWRDEAAVSEWRNLEVHRRYQDQGRHGVFDDYRVRVAHVVRDYGPVDRAEAPEDSRHKKGGEPSPRLHRLG
jgi:heme-degrading monooxygenase HmoA